VVSSTPLPARQRAGVSIGATLDRLPVVRTHRLLTTAVGAGLFFDFFDSNLSGTISKVLQTDFAVGATSLKLILASAFVGQFFGALLLGRLADRVGRRTAFLINLAVYSIATLAGAFAPTAAWLIVTRFVAGVGIGAEQCLSDSYLAEILPPTRRGQFVGWAYTLAYCGVPAVGFAALWLTPHHIFGVVGWRWLFVLGAVGSVVAWLLRRRLIESPRWLASRGRNAEAEELVSAMRAEAVLASAEEPVVEPQPTPEVTSVLAILRRPYLRRTIMLWVFCALSSVIYYGFGTLAPQVLAEKGYSVVQGLTYTAVSFLGYPIGSLLSLPLLDRMERRTLLATSGAAVAGCGLGFGLSGASAAVVAFGVAYTLLSNVFANVSHVYLAEQYPTGVRTTAVGAAYSLSRLSTGALPFVLLPVLTAGGPVWLFVAIAGCAAVLVTTVLALGGRTTGSSVGR
jgi:putative MFS transporter